VPVRAHWLLPEGTRVGIVPATSGLRAGDEAQTWLDQNGNVVSQPLDLGDATAAGITAAALIWLSAVGLLTAAYFAAVAGLNHHRSASWGRAWAKVEPDWSRRA
jgi:hypothetical protein